LHVYQAKPNKEIETLYWKGNWREGVPGVLHCKWLGKASEMTREQALEKLAIVAGEDWGQHPKPDKPPGPTHESQGMCQQCLHRFIFRLRQLEKEYAKAHPQEYADQQTESLTSRIRNAERILGRARPVIEAPEEES